VNIDEFLASVRESYTPQGDGTYHGIPPCSDCGSHTFDLTFDTPRCLPCSVKEENLRVYMEALVGALDRLGEMVPELPPRLRALLHTDAALASFATARIVYGTAS
jgi:hypothetical protein